MNEHYFRRTSNIKNLKIKDDVLDRNPTLTPVLRNLLLFNLEEDYVSEHY